MDDDAPYRRDDRSEFRGSEPRRSSGRESEPLDQRLDRWVSAGRQFVDGVAGGRPGSRPPARGSESRGAGRGSEGRGSEARTAGRGGFDGLGRWVEERLDWLLEDGDDWREPWQDTGPGSPSPPLSQPDSRRNLANPATRYQPAELRNPANLASAVRPLTPTNSASADRPRNQTSRTNPYTNPVTAADATTAASMPRRRLEALSRRGLTPQSPAATTTSDRDRDRQSESEVWPDDDSFSLPHWQRPAATGRAPEPSPPAADSFDGGGRPLPRSSRRASRRPGP